MGRRRAPCKRRDQPGGAVVAGRRGGVESQGGRGGQVLRRLPRRGSQEHERGCRLAFLFLILLPETNKPGPANESLPRGGGRLRPAARGRELPRSTAYVGKQSRGLPIEIAVTRRASRFSRPGARHSSGARDSSTWPARSATTRTGANRSLAPRSRRPIRPAIRSTAWNGRTWARCSGACATA